ncbi:hypothetical protein HMPREF3188_01510 [Tissierellia bacterium KA00581]|jgi:hypothetical protein|nr:hypothetical protein HMPREF3188_01510 [Tissierellia bacterium KA00581]
MYEKINEKEIYNGKILKLKIENFKFEGKIIKREIVQHKDAVAILPIDDLGFVYLVKQYRFPVQKEFLEIPAGLVEENEDYEKAALRELQEEVGFFSKNLQKIFEGYNSVGFCNEKTIIYIAKDLVSSKLPEDEDENLTVVKIHIDKLKQMYLNNEINDFKTAIAILSQMN